MTPELLNDFHVSALVACGCLAAIAVMCFCAIGIFDESRDAFQGMERELRRLADLEEAAIKEEKERRQ